MNNEKEEDIEVRTLFWLEIVDKLQECALKNADCTKCFKFGNQQCMKGMRALLANMIKTFMLVEDNKELKQYDELMAKAKLDGVVEDDSKQVKTSSEDLYS